LRREDKRAMTDLFAKLTFEATETCVVMENGRIAMTGSSADLAHDPLVRQIYLGL
jgi:branched-chain amino acid transport system ATP-binding protein